MIGALGVAIGAALAVTGPPPNGPEARWGGGALIALGGLAALWSIVALLDPPVAVVIQDVVGTYHKDHFYPHISGTGQSHNYYPVAHMEPEDGFAIAGLGLGH